ncbi:MAG TPA: DNA-directed RNA polymerase subunit beta' [Candidatus Paceibacterota bacterium]|nr:DNA-directed RNA polymerase subunit beta' [Candidatus Paceibacterota bacterium]
MAAKTKRSLPKKYFSRFREPLVELPNLVESQVQSFDELVKEGASKVFKEFSPISDHAGKKFELRLDKFSFGEPRWSEEYAKQTMRTYEAPLSVIAKLKNKTTGAEKEQEIFLADFPWMTKHGTFIINGVERIVVPQLARSYGVFFEAVPYKGKNYFAAKVIPSRGVWIEIESDPDGGIYVKIDRKRRFPVTSLLRVLGATADKDIVALFKDESAKGAIQTTLGHDTAKATDEAYVEIYRRLRDGDIATGNAARDHVDAILSAERYDLSRVGRFHFNRRWGLPTGEKDLARSTLSLDDIVRIVTHIAQLNADPEAQPDDIDHLGFRRVRFVGELLEQRMRIGLSRMKRNIQDRMAMVDPETTLPVQFINPRPFQASIREFFTTDQLSQLMQQYNSLDEIEHLRTLSTLGRGGLVSERAGLEVRDVHSSHYGRVCPIHTPEGKNIGLVLHMALYARPNEFGVIETPYAKVEKGKVTKEIVYMNALDEEKYCIAHAATERDEDGKIIPAVVEVRKGGEPTIVSRTEVDYIEIATNQPFSVATSLIPFVENDDANRALMGSNMQKQAVPLVVPDAPLVATGIETEAARDSGRLCLSEEAGEVTYVDAKSIKVKNQDGKSKEYKLVNFSRTNGFTAFHQRPVVSVGDKVKKGSVLADASTSDKGQLAIGQNVRVAFLPWFGANFEDAIVISERLAKDARFTSIHMEEFICIVRDTKLGPEVTTHDIPNVSEFKLRNLDEEGIVRIGAEVRTGDILVGKVTPKGETQLTPEERLLHAIFGEKAKDVKDTSLRMEGGKRGRVVSVKVFSRENGDVLESGVIKRVHVEVAQLRTVSVGDKLAGRHGNKGVISRVLPEEDMPFDENGEPVDIILTPLGVPSRMNLGQILELHLGLAAEKQGYQAIVPSFAGATEEEIKEELKAAGFREDGKRILFDGRTGEPFSQPVSVGIMYMLKLHHMVEDKIHMRSIGPYSLTTQQPLGGKAQNGGQRVGEMEVWAFLGYGAAYSLREILTYKSDDILGRSAAFDAIVSGERIKESHTPATFNVLVRHLRGLGIDLEFMNEGGDALSTGRPHNSREENNVSVQTTNLRRNKDAIPQDFSAIAMRLASPDKIYEWSHGEITKPETINYRTQRPEKNGLFDERVFGPEKDYECYCGKYRGIRFRGIVCEKCGVEITRAIVRRERMGHIDLATPVAHIWFLRGIPSRIALVLGLSAAEVEKVVYFAGYIVTSVDENERGRLLKELDHEYSAKSKSAQPDEKTRLKDLATKAKKDIESIREGAVLDEATYHLFAVKYGAMFRAAIGPEALYNLLKKIDLDEFITQLRGDFENAGAADRDRVRKRLALAEAMKRAGVRPEWMFLTRLPVVPPALRPMVALEGGRHASSDLNDLYRRVINRNNRLKRLMAIHAPDVILRNEKRILQEAVDALLDNSMRHGAGVLGILGGRRRALKSLADYLKGKHGYLRQNLLGKRVDYSGRSVIVVGPDLALDECGLPKHMVLELFRPFVIHGLLAREYAYNIRGAGRMIEDEAPEVWPILEEAIRGKYVLLNRAPTLHRQSIQAFRPVLIEGNAIQIHPLVCPAYNADFDGDAMAVHVPLSEEAQMEAAEIMSANKNVLKPGSGDVVVASKLLDIVLGCFWVTRIVEGANGEGKTYPTTNAAITAYDFGAIDLRAKIWVLPSENKKYAAFDGKPFETSVGRLLFNSILPNDFPYFNDEITNKKMAGLVQQLVSHYSLDGIPAILDKIKAFGFKYATYAGITWSISDVHVPEAKQKLVEEARAAVLKERENYENGLLTDDERRRATIEIWGKASGELRKHVVESLDPAGPVHNMITSGARGSVVQLHQMAGMKGLITNPRGEVIEFPIISSYKEGLTPIEYFTSTHGARKGLADTALNTARAGYLTRRLFDVAHDVVVLEDDCGTKEGAIIPRPGKENIGGSFSDRLVGRVLAEDVEATGVTFKRNTLLSRDDAKAIENSDAQQAIVRSPMTCKVHRGVCQKCYGIDLTTGQMVAIGEAVGVVAAQAIGEPGTQLTMRTFHTGGVAQTGGDITMGLPRVEEVFESRMPKLPAALARADGVITDIVKDGQETVITLTPEGKAAKRDTEYRIHPARTILVKVGQSVQKGDFLTDGSADLDELFLLAGKERAQEYVIAEITRIYELQGVSTARKHLEIIVKQMFSRMQVTFSGDTGISAGEIIADFELERVNKKMKEEGKEPAKAKQLLLGITEVSLTRASFLSAISFQNTPRKLAEAAVSGAVDRLVGLKENVIIGRLIPAGTGFKGSEKNEMISQLQEKLAAAEALMIPVAEAEKVTRE